MPDKYNQSIYQLKCFDDLVKQTSNKLNQIILYVNPRIIYTSRVEAYHAN